MVLVMLEKYNKYWADVSGLMGVMTILDPRFKMKLIHFYFVKIYDELPFQTEIDRIQDLLRELVDEYGHKNSKSEAKFVEQDNGETAEKSDLDKYLEAANIPLVDDFDILNWWKTNRNSYLTLQQVERDILSIFVSTIPSESAFSTGRRVIGPYRNVCSELALG
ncbi:hypothetical protein V6N13_039734 [Hibiscus sabdariffa]